MQNDRVIAKVFENPLPGIEPRQIKVAVGSPIRDIIVEYDVPMVCVIDGIPLKREWWMQRLVCEGDSIEFHPVFLGGGGSRSILGAIASILLVIAAPYIVGAIGSTALGTAGALTNLGRLVAAGIVLVGNALISAVIMPNGSSSNTPDKPSSVYDVDTQGNQAKLFSPIPVQYGRMKAFPDYASQPYVRYYTSEDVLYQIQLKGGAQQKAGGQQQIVVPSGASVSGNGDQFYFALFCLGQGEYEVEGITIADADINSFSDVLVKNILPPGEAPKYVNPCVVTSEAVAGQSLDKGEYIGGFPTCGPGKRTSRISLDFVFPQGLCKVDDKGKAKSASVQIMVDIAPYSDASLLSAPWQNIYTGSYSAASMTPQRRTLDLDVPSGRYMVRVCRVGQKDPEDNRDLTSCIWQALRAELDDEAPLCATATHFELVMRASEQLSSLSQRKIGIICTRKVRDWSGALVPSRSPVLALRDKWQNSVYGDGLPDDRIDTPTLRALDELCQQRQDRFDYRFESRITSREADLLIAAVIRSVVLQRQGVKTIVRDGLAELPITMFTPTNTVEGSVSMDYIQVTEETADGVIGEFFNHNTWLWDEVECPAPGFSASSPTSPFYDPSLPQMQNPIRLRLEGITGRTHALREALYLATTNALRRQFVTFSTELQGALVYYGAPVLFASTLYNSESGGEVMDYRDSDGAFRLSGDVTSGSRIVFMFPNGTVTQPQDITSLGNGWVIVRGQGVPVSYGSHSQERTRYALVTGELFRHMIKLTAVNPQGMGDSGAPKYELKGVVDVPEVHLVDVPFLPRPGEEQDIPGGGMPPSLDVPYITLNNTNGINVFTKDAMWPNSGYPPSVVFYPDGRMAMRYYDNGRVESNSQTMNGMEYTLPRFWVSVPQSNVGTEYEIAIIISFGWRDKIEIEQFEKYMWLAENPPAGNLILQGIRLSKVASGQAADSSTESLISLARPTEWPYSPSYISPWMSMTQEIEFRAFWKGFSSYMDQGVMKDLNISQITGAVGIRDKRTKTFQGSAGIQMGVLQSYANAPGGSITI